MIIFNEWEMFSCFKHEKSFSFNQFQLMELLSYYIIHIFHRSIQRIFKNHPDKETYSLNRITGDSFKFRENTEKLPPPWKNIFLLLFFEYIAWKYIKIIILHSIQFLNEKSSSLLFLKNNSSNHPEKFSPFELTINIQFLIKFDIFKSFLS